MKRYRLALVGITTIACGVAAYVVLGPPKHHSRTGNEQRPSLESLEASTTVSSVKAWTNTKADSVVWNRFRGPNGTGVSPDSNVPTEWSDTQNLRWKCKLPGAGSSSPILTKKFVFLSCYSGYGIDRNQGTPQDLKRQIVCVDRESGKIAWKKNYDAAQPEDRYQGMGVPEHGYATNTGTTDGELVFMFLGKSGVLALDLEGNEKWRVSVGTESGNRQWGSASSLILYDDMLIVNASEESQTLYGLEKLTGKVVWKAPAASLELCYSTPAICKVSDDRDDLVIAVPSEIWGLNPQTGKLIWYAETQMTGNLSPSVIVDGTTVYAFGGYQSSGSIAVRAGGNGDVTNSHILWKSKTSSYVPTPVLNDGKFFWIDDRGMYYCLDASNGNQLEKSRGPDFGGGRPVYASPILVNGKIYVQSRWGGLVVLDSTNNMKVLSHNRFESDSSTFNATPAVDRGQLYLRSNEFLYRIEKSENKL
jgi:outer membrane protein assembly factor BamB